MVESTNMVDQFSRGHEAYFASQWATAEIYMAKAAKLHEQEGKVKIDCRTECRQQRKKDGAESLQLGGEAVVHFSRCVAQCEAKALRRGFRYMDRKDIMNYLNNRETYNFLQHSQFQVGVRLRSK